MFLILVAPENSQTFRFRNECVITINENAKKNTDHFFDQSLVWFFRLQFKISQEEKEKSFEVISTLFMLIVTQQLDIEERPLKCVDIRSEPV